MKRLIPVLLLAHLFAGAVNAQLPFKYDSLYKTLYAHELCKLLNSNSNVVLIDVRSPGEFSDTSRFASLNLGHLKGAINMEIAAMNRNIDTLKQFKDKTMVFYCSHSQRSRRVSRLLAEHGYTNFYNLNGGMSVLTQMDARDFPCKKDLVVSDLPYRNLTRRESADLIKKEKKLVVIDVRPAIQYNSADTVLQNNVGRIRGAINIPYAEFQNRIGELANFKTRPILVYSSSGDGDGARAATDLVKRGFVSVYHLLGGIGELVSGREDLSMIESAPPYTLLDVTRALKLLRQQSRLTIYDTRPDEEFGNKLTGMPSYKNLGHLKNAVHVSENSFETTSFPSDKSLPILLYGHGESFKLAALLTRRGYHQVNVLGSFYDFVWSGYNLQNCAGTKEWLTDHKGLY